MSLYMTLHTLTIFNYCNLLLCLQTLSKYSFCDRNKKPVRALCDSLNTDCISASASQYRAGEAQIEEHIF